MTDRELIEGMKKEEADAERFFRELYDAYTPPLYKFVYQYVKSADTAKEITHEALVKLWLHRETLDPDRSVKGYLFATCRNSLIKELRRQVRNPNFRDYLSIIPEAGVESPISYDYDAYLRAVRSARETLTPRQKEILILSREEGLSAGEIATRLGISEQVVRNQLSAAMKIIREKIKFLML